MGHPALRKLLGSCCRRAGVDYPSNTNSRDRRRSMLLNARELREERRREADPRRDLGRLGAATAELEIARNRAWLATTLLASATP
jgi:hypothetical protein